MVWRSDSRNARRSVSSRSVPRNSRRRSPRMPAATACATSEEVRPSAAARWRLTTICTSSSPSRASERTDSSPFTLDMTRATSSPSTASFSVDSPVSCTLKRWPPMELASSHLKLGLPMMISGRPSCAFCDEFLRLEAAFVARLEHDDGERARLVVDRVDALDAELFAALLVEMPLDGFNRGFHAIDRMRALDVVAEEYLVAAVLRAGIELDEFSGIDRRQHDQARR